MANNVAISQDEVDKLLGITTKGSAPKVEKKTYKVENFLSEDDFQQIRLVCKSTYKYFKISLKDKIGQPKIRKLIITALEETNADEFFDLLSDNDLAYQVKFQDASLFIKLDSSLFASLSGFSPEKKGKVNFFQSQVLKDYVVNLMAEGFQRQLEKDTDFQVIPLLDQDKKPFQTGKTGLCVSINWNENLRSFGVEKIFLTKEIISSFRLLSK